MSREIEYFFRCDRCRNRWPETEMVLDTMLRLGNEEKLVDLCLDCKVWLEEQVGPVLKFGHKPDPKTPVRTSARSKPGNKSGGVTGNKSGGIAHAPDGMTFMCPECRFTSRTSQGVGRHRSMSHGYVRDDTLPSPVYDVIADPKAR